MWIRTRSPPTVNAGMTVIATLRMGSQVSEVSLSLRFRRRVPQLRPSRLACGCRIRLGRKEVPWHVPPPRRVEGPSFDVIRLRLRLVSSAG
ncbi:hypothetical protein B0H12DRAFT_107618 [Mycena haematopus]|nr:hypothetical protein B0H12DRAFT_107618 [Mycena haematopus]